MSVTDLPNMSHFILKPTRMDINFSILQSNRKGVGLSFKKHQIIDPTRLI